MWTTAAATLVTAALSIVPGSLALWNDADSVNAGFVSSGQLDAAIAPGTTMPTTDTMAALGALAGMVPGESRGAPFTVRNTGTVPLQLAAARAASTHQYLLLDLAPGVCAPTPAAGVVLSSTPTNIGATIPPATNATFCLRITLDESTPASFQGSMVGSYGADLTAGVR